MRTGLVIVAHGHWLAVVADPFPGSAESWSAVADVSSLAVAGPWLLAVPVSAGSVLGSSPVALASVA